MMRNMSNQCTIIKTIVEEIDSRPLPAFMFNKKI